jgi:Uma2 family endonuclease
MSTTEAVASTAKGKATSPSTAEIEALLPNVELVESDGQNMESDLHRLNMELLLSAIACHFRGRDDYYASGNSFIYYSTEQARHRDFKGPDFYLIKGVAREPIRPYWAVWNEGGRYPDVIVELLSPSTRQDDLTTKKDVYEKTFHTGNYFCFDPQTKELLGWRLERSGYDQLEPNANGQLWCDELNLWLGVWEGEFHGFHESWLRFFTPEGKVVPVPTEFVESELAAAQRRAAIAQQRAEAAEAELAKLKARLAEYDEGAK